MIRVKTETAGSSPSVVFYADNYINDVEGEMLEKLCEEYFDKGVKNVLIDFSNTELVNSIGISILIGIVDKARGKESMLMFSGLRKVNQKIFDMFGLTRHVIVFDSEKEALKEIARG